MSTATASKVKAYELDGEFGIDALTVRERAAQQLQPDQVRVRVKATSLNYRDLMVIKGLYSKNLPKPLTPLSDCAGEVLEVGALVKRVKVGDRVVGAFMQNWIAGPLDAAKAKSALGAALDGVLADQIVLQGEGVVQIPDYLSFEEAATLPCAAVTAWNAVVATGQIKAGETLVTLGTGGVSLFALQFAKANGARVIITSSSDEKLQRAKELGATDVINYKTNPDWEKEVIKLTGGVGADQVVELGGAGTFEKSLKAVKLGGYVSMIGVLSGGAGSLNLTPVLMKNIRVQGIMVGSRHMFEEMLAAMTLHKIKPVIDGTFAFDQVKEALKHMEAGAHFGKIVIKV
ncbi:MAG TPA: NAD(P)-dependent alcohol dehydrogenase [Planktothrix sp.]|jgi:NADPH:quinone reductase-like Zn-dependent oxidoreductase